MADIAARVIVGNDLPIHALISVEDVDYTDENVARLRYQTVALMEDTLRSPEFIAFFDGLDAAEPDIDPRDAAPVTPPDMDDDGAQ